MYAGYQLAVESGSHPLQLIAALCSNSFVILLYNYNKVSNLYHERTHRLLSPSHFPPFSDFGAD
jgi:hypothetical protein